MTTMIIWIPVFVGIFYFLAIRPQRRRRRAHDEMVGMLRRGDEIITIGGLFGTVSCVGDDWIELVIANRTRVRLMKRAISSVATSSDSEDEELIEADDGLAEDEASAEEAEHGLQA